jgi:hypothetical protein
MCTRVLSMAGLCVLRVIVRFRTQAYGCARVLSTARLWGAVALVHASDDAGKRAPGRPRWTGWMRSRACRRWTSLWPSWARRTSTCRSAWLESVTIARLVQPSGAALRLRRGASVGMNSSGDARRQSRRRHRRSVEPALKTRLYMLHLSLFLCFVMVFCSNCCLCSCPLPKTCVPAVCESAVDSSPGPGKHMSWYSRQLACLVQQIPTTQ